MCTYLDKVGATYYFRRVVPRELRPFLLTATGNPRSEFKISLKTKDRDTAKRLIRPHADEADRLFDEAKRKLAAMSANPIERAREAAQRRLEAERFAHEEEAAAFFAEEDAEQEARRELRAEARRQLEERLRLSTKELSPEEAVISDILRDKDFDLEVARTRLRTYGQRLQTAAATGNAYALWQPASGALPAAPLADRSVGTSLETIIGKLAKERNIIPKSVDAYKAVARWFYERAGTIAANRSPARTC